MANFSRFFKIFFTFALAIFAVILVAKFQATPWALVFNVSHYFLAFAVMFLLSGQIARSVNFASVWVILIYYLSRINYLFYRKPLDFADFIVYFDPSN